MLPAVFRSRYAGRFEHLIMLPCTRKLAQLILDTPLAPPSATPPPVPPFPRVTTKYCKQIANRHVVGTKFVVCLKSPGPNTKAQVITGVVSSVDEPLEAWSSPAPTRPLIHGGGPDMTVDNWVEVNGDIGEGQRLSAWVY